jgi:hypothetical protein
MKAGFITKQHEAAVSKASAWAETLGYAANIALSCHKLQQLQLQETLLLRKVQAACKVGVLFGRRGAVCCSCNPFSLPDTHTHKHMRTLPVHAGGRRLHTAGAAEAV